MLIALVLPVLPILVSGDWTWWEGWAFFLHEGIKSFDKILAPLVALGIIPVGIVTGFDHGCSRAWASTG